MKETISTADKSPIDYGENDISSVIDEQPEPVGRFGSEFVNIERRSPGNTVFHTDDATIRSSMPRATHWSVAWSDLMMTMFILFLSMFVYQTANQEFLREGEPEIIGGDTTEALESIDESGASFPFSPIHPGVPLMTAGTIKKVESVPAVSAPVDVLPTDTIQEGSIPADDFKIAEDFPPPDEELITEVKESEELKISPEKIAIVVPELNDAISLQTVTTPPPLQRDVSESEDVFEPKPLIAPEPELEGDFIAETGPVQDQLQFQELFTIGKDTLESNNLDKFAALDLVPDKTMRIILTSDLLYALGESELSGNAKSSLTKIAAVVKFTPYMINVVGHTDNIPMRSNRFKSNWELSVARASSVTQFLINDIGMNPNQFVVSGYASYRPLVPNTTAHNRAKNRRVEIIISKRLPKPLPPTADNLR